MAEGTIKLEYIDIPKKLEFCAFLTDPHPQI